MKALMFRAASKGRRLIRQPNIAWNYLRGKVKNTGLDYHLGRGASFPPISLFHAVTEVCNTKCLYCTLQEKAKEITFPDLAHSFIEPLDWQDQRRVIDHYATIRPNVNIGGGEPTTYPHLVRMVEYLVQEKGLCTAITTNGLLLERKAEELIRAGLTVLYVSLDGVGEVYDRVRGKGNFAKVERGLRTFLATRENLRTDFPELRIIFTINSANHRNIAETVAWALDLGIRFILVQHLGRCPPALREAHNARYPRPELQIPWDFGGDDNLADMHDADPGAIIAGLDEARALGMNRGAYFQVSPDFTPEQVRAYYRDPDGMDTTGLDCRLLWSAVYVFPHGDVFPSQFCFFHPMGSLLEKDIRHIWNSEKYKEIRLVLKEQRYFDVCKRCPLLHGGCL